MRICLAHSPPLRNFLSSYEECRSRAENSATSLRPCINTRGEAEVMTTTIAIPSSPRMGLASPSTKPRRAPKKVVFADSKGLSLTAIHVFKEFEDDLMTDLQFDLLDLKLPEDRSLVLDFAQPAADYLDFRNRLKKNQVCLENCTVQSNTVSGTVKVRNVSFEKSVWLRITLDKWKTNRDVECTYLNNVYGCPDTDTFAFSIDLPDSAEHLEFCIQYKTQDDTFWDNNNGNNYRLSSSEAKQSETNSTVSGTSDNVVPSQHELTREVKQQMEFDQFGSPRTSSGFFPEWQSWGRVDATTIYW